MRSLGAVLMLVLVLPAAAHGATSVTISGADLDITGADESSVLTITAVNTDFRVEDTGATVTPVGTCVADGANAALCPMAGVTLFDASMGNGDDQVTVAPTITVAADLEGGNGNDTLKGGAAADALKGEGNDDTLQGFGGSDDLDGGTGGGDSVLYAERGAGQGINVTLDSGTDNDGGSGGTEGDHVVQTEHVTGGAGDDALTGNNGGNNLSGGPGCDTLTGNDSNDVLDGGSGPEDDFLFGGHNLDRLFGGPGNDTLDGGTGDDGTPAQPMDGGPGDDTITGGTQQDVMRGGSGADGIDCGPNDSDANLDTVMYDERPAGDPLTITLNAGTDDDGSVGEGDDVVGCESLVGGAGHDTITGDGGANSLHGQGGDDDLFALGGNDSLNGGFGTPGNDELYGGEGNDEPMQGWDGDDVIDGGPGNDRFLDGNEGTDTIRGGDGHDLLRGDNAGFGDAFVPDSMEGGAGNDTMTPNHGGGLVDGGPGSDLLVLTSIGGPSVWTLDGVANDTTGVGTYNVMNGETIELPSGSDDFTGTGADETIRGGEGVDVLRGMGGDDTIRGGGGADQILGGPGNDTGDLTDQDNGNVTLDGVANDAHQGGVTTENVDTENLICCGGGSPNVLTGNDEGNTILAQGGPTTINAMGGNDLIRGGGSADTINAGAGDDLIAGGDAADTLNGEAGDDTFDGTDPGADAMNGGDDFDFADYAGAIGPLTITLDGAANDPGGDNVQTEMVRGTPQADTITGGPAAETLVGGPGNDQLRGGSGADLLIGETGADLLDGQGDVDRVDYTDAIGPITVRLNGDDDDGITGEGDDVRVEQVIGSDFDDLLVGDAEANLFNGGEGADAIDGAAGADELIGGLGSDAVTSGAGADILRMADGLADTLTCDDPAGKTVEADALDSGCGITRESTGAQPGPAPSPGGGSPSPFVPPEPTTVLGSPRGAAPRDAAALARALTGRPRKGRALRPFKDRLDLGDLRCLPGRTCTVTVTVRRAKGSRRALASAKLTDRGTVDVSVPLTRTGRRAARSRRGLRVRATIAIAEDAVRASVPLEFVLRRAR